MLLIDGVYTGSCKFFSAVFRLTILMSKFLSQVVTLGWAFVIRVSPILSPILVFDPFSFVWIVYHY